MKLFHLFPVQIISRNGKSSSKRPGRSRCTKFQSSKNRFKKSKSPNSEACKSVTECVYQIGAAKHASELSPIADCTINCIEKTHGYGDDIGNTLQCKTEAKIPTPTLKASTATDAAAWKTAEEETNKILCTTEAKAEACACARKKKNINLTRGSLMHSHGTDVAKPCKARFKPSLIAKTTFKLTPSIFSIQLLSIPSANKKTNAK